MATFLINAVDEQVIQTRAHGTISCIAFSNPAWYEPRTVLGAAFGDIRIGDTILLCKGSKLRYVAAVEAVVQEIDDRAGTSYFGLPVRVLQGKVRRRFGDVSVEAVMKRLQVAKLAVPGLINASCTGFKQGAFCARVADETAAAICRDWLPSK